MGRLGRVVDRVTHVRQASTVPAWRGTRVVACVRYARAMADIDRDIDTDASARAGEVLEARGLAPEVLDDLATSLLWRIGRAPDDGPITVRVGFATSASLFGELPRLRNATEEELVAAVDADEVHVEWVGPRAR